MSTLHTRGYSPKPGERRRGPCAFRLWWKVEWRNARLGRVLDRPWSHFARVSLDARLAPDPLVWAQAGRIIKVSGLGRGDGDRMAPGLVLARRNARALMNLADYSGLDFAIDGEQVRVSRDGQLVGHMSTVFILTDGPLDFHVRHPDHEWMWEGQARVWLWQVDRELRRSRRVSKWLQ